MKRYIRSAILNLCSESIDIRVAISDDPNADPNYLTALAKDGISDIRIRVAKNPNTPISALKELAADPNFNVRDALSFRKDLPTDVLEILAKSNRIDELAMLDRIARSNNITENILIDTLLRDNKDHDRAYVISRSEKATEKVLRHIFDYCYSDASILHRVAKNPNTPEDVLQKIAQHPDDWACIPAKKRLGMPI
jgi:hypothetical protein